MESSTRAATVRNTVRVFGAWWTVRALVAVLAEKASAPETVVGWLEPHGRNAARWDRRHGTNTGGMQMDVHSSFPAAVRADSHGYAGSPARQIEAAIADFDFGDDDVEFWDLGSGKGRAVLCAALTGRFRRCVGVELDPDLVRVARDNESRLVATAPEISPITWLETSATEIELPDDCSLVIYMYDPFEGRLLETVLDRVARHQAETGMPVWIVYATLFHADQFTAHPSLHLVRTTTVLPWAFSWMVLEVRSSG